MTEIQNSYVYPQQQYMPMNKEALKYQVMADAANRSPRSAEDEFVHQHKKNGLIERLYNGIKNLTGLGIGSKKVKAELQKVESGEITEDQAKETIDKYRKSQVNSAQGFGDLMSVGASGITYFGLRNALKMEYAKNQLNNKFGTDDLFKELVESGGTTKEMISNGFKKVLAKVAGSKTKLALVTASLAGLVGGFTKYFTLKLNRIGASDNVKKKDFNGAKTPYDKAAYKYEKKLKKSENRKASFRNFTSGMLNGLLMPISVVGGAIIGVPAYLAANSLNRYFIGNPEEKDKSLKNYVENLKSDVITHSALAASFAIPLVRKGHFSAVFDKNFEKAFSDIMAHSELKNNPYGGKTAYQQLNEILFAEPEISSILENNKFIHRDLGSWWKPNESYHKVISDKQELEKISPKISKYIKEQFGENATVESIAKSKNKYDKDVNLLIRTSEKEEPKWMELSKVTRDDVSVEDRIKALTEKNIFAVKFKQIENGNDKFTEALKENCPYSREFDEAVKIIEKTYGNKYKVKSRMGAGTVAETYLAEDANGKEVCIKLLKEGITADKIARDKKAFIDLVNSLENKSAAEKKYLIKNIEDLAEGIGQEIDLKNELEAAKKLVDYTKTANVVKPVEVKDGIYVMEKANGISFKKLLDINTLKTRIYHAEQWLKEAKSDNEKKWAQDWLNELKAEEKLLSTKYKDIILSEKEFSDMIDEYMNVLVEQLYKTDASGRVLHADIHPGNIFIDIDALKAKKGKIFTLIDTGNTITLTAEQAARTMKLTQYIERGDTKDLAKYFIEDANLAESGLTKEEAEAKIEEALNRIFFDSETRLNKMTNTEIINITSNIMKDLKIMPGSSQLNLEKARKSAGESFKALLKMWAQEAGKAIDAKSNEKTQMLVAARKTQQLLAKYDKYVELQKMQEKRDMLKLLKSPVEYFKSQKNPNYKDRNSVEYITYHLKQGLSDPNKDASFFGM